MKAFLISGLVLCALLATLLVAKNVYVKETDSLSHSEYAALTIWGDVCGTELNPSIAIKNLPGDTAGRADAAWIKLPRNGKRYTRCNIFIDPRMKGERYCAAVVHEWGHLAGHRHSDDKDSVMYFKITKRNTPKLCK